MAETVATVEDITGAPRADYKRSRFGAPLVTPPPGYTGKVGRDGHITYRRPSSAGKVLEDSYHLDRWKLRMVAAGLAARQELVALAATSLDDKKALDGICDRALEAAQASAGADYGTALHALTHRADAGQAVDPGMFAEHLDRYRATLDGHGIDIIPALIERAVVCDELAMAGTADRYVHWRGRLVVADLKCGSGIWDPPIAYAVQLAIYARSVLYDIDTGQRAPIEHDGQTVDHTAGLIIHLPAAGGPCTIHEVDLTAAWDLTLLSQQVREARRIKGLASALPEPEALPADPLRAQLQDRIDWVKAHQRDLLPAVVAAWKTTGLPTFKQSQAHTRAELERIKAALDRVLDEPFDPSSEDLAASAAKFDRVAALRERLRGLPADLIDRINQTARRAGLRRLSDTLITPPELDRVTELVGEAEAEAQQRDQVVAAVAEGDLDRLAAACRLARGAAGKLTEKQAAHAVAVLDAETIDGLITFADGRYVPVEDVAGLLVERHGSKSALLGAVKGACATYGAQPPRSTADIAADPALIALAAVSATNPATKETADQ